ncbi:unnamed protein product, partial [Meganyctiphanes norvegica]
EYVQMGVFTWSTGCAIAGNPDVYGSVPQTVDWISQTLQSEVAGNPDVYGSVPQTVDWISQTLQSEVDITSTHGIEVSSTYSIIIIVVALVLLIVLIVVIGNIVLCRINHKRRSANNNNIEGQAVAMTPTEDAYLTPRPANNSSPLQGTLSEHVYEEVP